MEWSLFFIFNNIMLGTGLAMDAFSVSLANGLNEPGMRKRRMCQIAGVYAGFQALMPMAGWFFVHTAARVFQAFEGFIPWIALFLLVFIGGNMLREGIHNKDSQEEHIDLGITVLLMQGVATSIDALSVGFTIAGYKFPMALSASMIIAAVTFAICMCGLIIGKRFGTKFSNHAQILGGVILIVIGLEIFISGI